MMVGFTGAIAALAPSPASASVCGNIDPPGYMLPPPDVRAPRNVRPLIRLPIGGGAEPCPYALCAADVESLELRTAPGPTGSPATIAVDVTEARAGDVATYAMRPRGLLSRSRGHEVFAVLRAAPGRPAGARRLVGSFRTGEAIDRTAPTWPGIQPPEVFPWKPPLTLGERRKLKKGTIILTSDPQPLRTYADVWGQPALDLDTPPDVISYAVRVVGADGKIDPTTMPRGYFRGEIDLRPDERTKGHLFWLGQPNMCFAHTFDFPASGQLTIGVTAVDLAGNESQMFVQTMDVGPK